MLDLKLTDTDGEAVLKELQHRGCLMPVIVLSAYVTVPYTVRLVRQGAFDVLEKPIDREKLLSSVAKAFVFDAEQRSRISGYHLVSRRELEVLNLLAEARSTKQIAAQLKLSPKTVEKHRSNVLAKLNVETVAQLVRIVLPARLARQSKFN